MCLKLCQRSHILTEADMKKDMGAGYPKLLWMVWKTGTYLTFHDWQQHVGFLFVCSLFLLLFVETVFHYGALTEIQLSLSMRLALNFQRSTYLFSRMLELKAWATMTMSILPACMSMHSYKPDASRGQKRKRGAGDTDPCDTLCRY